MTTGLCLLLHMHQPDYRPAPGEKALLPWVRLHAVRGYADVASMLERHPQARLCVNFSGILIEQLQQNAELAKAGDYCPDTWAELALLPAAQWTAEQRLFALRQFFSAHPQNLIRPYPRYWELHERWQNLCGVAADEAASEFNEQDLTDLALLFNLAWLGFSAQRETLPRELRMQQRHYSHEQIAELLYYHAELGAGILPRYRQLAERGQIELSATPWQHPILPLLCDLAGEGNPNPADPLPQFRHVGDAALQVATAQQMFEAAFGAKPLGMWPAEGSVSDSALTVLARAGLRWAATDQANLPAGADTLGHLSPQIWRRADQQLLLLFRDTRLADNIGFVYSSWQPRAAVGHFTDIVQDLGRRSGLARPVVSVILDGENPWENYPDGGEGFFTELCESISRHEGIRCLTPADLLGEDDLPVLEHVHSGSWIGGNFDIWSRHGETRQAWRLLAAAREELDADIVQGSDTTRALLTAEGSDWFWWYGDDFSSSSKDIFDELFRSRLQRAYLAAGRTYPPALDEPIGGSRAGEELAEPEGLVQPRLDGRVGSYFEWQFAREAGLQAGHSAMASAASGAVESLRYGFSLQDMFLCLELSAEWRELARRQGLQLVLCMLQQGLEFCVNFELPPSGQAPAGNALGHCAFEQVLELACPLDAAGVEFGQPAWFWLELRSPGAAPQRFPATGRVGVRIISRDFALRHWRL